MSHITRPDLMPTTFQGATLRVMEECGEVVQAACKMERFGFNPVDLKTGKSYNNVRDFFKECAEVINAIEEAKRLFRTTYACQLCFGVGEPGNNLFGDDSYQGATCPRCQGRGY